MKRRSYRIPCLVAQALLCLIVAASTSSAQNADALDHFLCYIISSETPQASTAATLTDQFFTAPGVSVKVGSPLQFCNPVMKKNGTDVLVDSTQHLTMYRLQKSPTLPAPRTLTATPTNTAVFGPQTLTVSKAATLMVPTAKNVTTIPDFNHFLCYPVSGKSLAQTVTLMDEFRNQPVIVEAPTLFCNPVSKTIGTNPPTDITGTGHLLCYDIRLPKSTESTTVPIVNQLETDTFTVTSPTILCVPSDKTVVR